MKNKPSILVILLVAVLIGIGAGCGYYSFSGAVPGGVKTIAIPLFDNNTSEFGIREQITDALVERFLQDNIVKVVDLGQAEAVLRGTILRVTDEPYTFQETETVQEYQVLVTITVTMEDTETGEAMWKQPFTEWGTYSLSSGTAEREAALTTAIGKLTEDISNKVVSGW